MPLPSLRPKGSHLLGGGPKLPERLHLNQRLKVLDNSIKYANDNLCLFGKTVGNVCVRWQNANFKWGLGVVGGEIVRCLWVCALRLSHCGWPCRDWRRSSPLFRLPLQSSAGWLSLTPHPRWVPTLTDQHLEASQPCWHDAGQIRVHPRVSCRLCSYNSRWERLSPITWAAPLLPNSATSSWACFTQIRKHCFHLSVSVGASQNLLHLEMPRDSADFQKDNF